MHKKTQGHGSQEHTFVASACVKLGEDVAIQATKRSPSPAAQMT
jgi:hypothetical protein